MAKDRELEDDSLILIPEEEEDPEGPHGTAPPGSPALRPRPRPIIPSSLPPVPRADRKPAPEADSLSQFIAASTTTLEEAEAPGGGMFPPQPKTLLDVGLSKAFLTDLMLKIVHYSGTPSMAQLIRRLGLGPSIVQQLASALAEERLLEVISQSDLYTGNYRYRLSEKGRARVAEALERSRYAGPAPVTAEQYSEVMRRVLAQKQDPGRARIKSIINSLVFSSETADSIARALYSGKAAILYGPSGNGKTVLLEQFARDLLGFMLVPYAIYAYGQVIRVFDQSIHEMAEDLDGLNMNKDDAKVDRRWVLIKRPAIVLGAEVGREVLDLAYDPQSRFYQAPPHIKVQGGLLVVDDFGRQKVEAREQLTRWLIPLDRGWDTLTLVTGEKLTVPFRVQLLFSTDLKVRELADDALLRRIPYKVLVPNPRPQEFMEILRQTARQRKILVQEGALDYVVEKMFSNPHLHPRASSARDVLDMLQESAAYDGREPVLDRESFDRVYRLFVAQENGGEEAGDY